MTVRGKPGKPNPGFPPFPPPVEIAEAIPTFPPLRRLFLYKGEAKPPHRRINNLGWAKLNRRNGPSGLAKRTWFTSDECPGILTTGKHIWPSIIWFSTPSMPTPNRLHPIDFQLDSESEDRVEAKYRALKGRTPDRCIVWTYTGLFETRRNWSDAQAIDVNGDPLGFGHLGKAPGQLIAKSADDVAVIPNCTAGKGRKKR